MILSESRSVLSGIMRLSAKGRGVSSPAPLTFAKAA